MDLRFWNNNKSKLNDWVLIYEGEMPPLADIDSIKRAKKVYEIYQESVDRLYFKATCRQAETIKKHLPNWKLVSVSNYGKIPEHSYRTSPKKNIKRNSLSLSKNQLLEVETGIRKYLLKEGNKARMVDVIGCLTTREIKWQHVMQAIHQSVDIKEDGNTVWLVKNDVKGSVH